MPDIQSVAGVEGGQAVVGVPEVHRREPGGSLHSGAALDPGRPAARQHRPPSNHLHPDLWS